MSEERFEGEVLGNRIGITTNNLLQILLLGLVVFVIYLGYLQIDSLKVSVTDLLQQDHQEILRHNERIIDILRIIDYNSRLAIENRIPIDFSLELVRLKPTQPKHATEPAQ